MGSFSALLARLAGLVGFGRRSRWPYAWAILGFVVLAALFLAPTLKTGYISDDNHSSLKPGLLRATNQSLTTYTLNNMRASMQEGRFYPVTWVPFNVVFCVIQDIYAYKIYIILMVIGNLILFIVLLRKISGDTGFACLAASLTLMLIQFRAFHDPVLSFYGLLQFLVAGMLLSLLALERYLDRRHAAWLTLSVVLYLVCMLLYEASYPLFLLHGLLIWRRRPEFRAWSPFLKAAAFCVFMSLLLRWLHPVDYSKPTDSAGHYQMNLAAGPVLETMIRQTSGALPLSYFLADPAGLFVGVKDSGKLAHWIGRGDVLAITVVALVVCLLSLTRDPRTTSDEPPPRSDWTLVTLLGLLLAVLPAVAVSLTSRYQGQIVLGKPYLPVYIQYFGVGVLLAVAIRFVLMRWSHGGRASRWSRMATAVVIGLTTGLTYRANCATTDSLISLPGTPNYNFRSFCMAGAWHHQRLNLQAALHCGLVEDVPEKAKLLLTNEYPHWYDAGLSVFFYAMHASKVFETIPPSTQKLLPAEALRGDSTYTVRDVSLGERSGFVVLSQEPSHGEGKLAGQGELRVFVRHPELFAHGSTPELLLKADVATLAKTTDPAGQPGFVRLGRDLRMIKSGPDWAMFSLRPDSGRVDPGSLSVVFGSVTAEWGDGFYPAEWRSREWWRWCSNRGSLTLHNTTDTPRKVNLSMQLQGRGDSALVLDGDSLHAEARPSLRPVRFEQEVTLTPGSHTITFSTEASPYVAPGDRRDLYVRMINFKILDQGRSQASDSESATRLTKRSSNKASLR